MRAELPALLVAAALAWGCGPGPDLDAGPGDGGGVDLGPDAGGVDAGLDAGIVDAGLDGGEADAGAAPDPTCTDDGCLREVVAVGTYTRFQIEAAVPPGIVVESGYDHWFLRYFTDGREATATVAIPNSMPAPAEGWPIAVNNPGTVGLGDVCAVSRGIGGIALAGTFGARGFVGVAVDYPGLGTPGPHPYLVSDVEGRASLDAIRATLAFADLRGLPLSGRAVVTGLSQGGHATLAAAREHATWAPELDIAAFAVAGPAAVWLEHWAPGTAVGGPHHVFTALLVRAWSVHYGGADGDLFAATLGDDLDALFEDHCLFGTDPVLDALIPDEPDQVFTPGLLGAFAAQDFAAYPSLAAGFTENRVAPWPDQTAPLRVYQGTADPVVLQAFTDAMVADLEAGGIDVDYQVVEGGGHTDVAFSVLGEVQLRTEESLGWLREQLALP